ncbi:restriction endonuclease subunit S [Chryseobacterium binzhouense]|uniref:restriction endonuclease subunit S n=1 Tax=Chryseobacterium binzhouense TaxID=2593646 RepID=UPI0028969A8D|nr:restriction endonuclease subunit S [Chryseobacterium binzhouense]
MNTKTTYKQTELGLIPEEWQVKKLGELGEFKNGINKDKEDFGFGIPMINLMDIFGINILNNSNIFNSLVNASASDIENYNLKKGDVIFVRSSVKPTGVGLTTLINDDFPNVVYSGFLIRFRTNSNFLNDKFKIHCFHADYFRNKLISKSTISANTNINQVALSSLGLILPPLPEQKAIADCLSTWDVAIDKQSQLIELLTQRKKALMQQLLTGKKRLPGFSEDWKEVKLGEISLKKSSTLQANSIEENKGIYNVYGANGIIANIDFFSEKEKYIGIVKDGSGVGNLMLCDANSSVLGTLDIIKNNHKTNLIFLFLILSKINFKKFTVGGAIPHIYYKDYSKEKIHIPSLSEQTAIAEILATADRELQLQKEKLTQLQTQKKGLMQVLLTGKKRLIN